jgi:glycerophosphoryl diester phosphodiesterase
MHGTKQAGATFAVMMLVAGCGDNQAPLPTLDGRAPLVVAHRGASGYLPEQTVEAYAMAIEMGAGAIEPDVVSTKDGVLIARHDPNLAYSTDVADHPEFAARKRTLSVDGDMQEGWFAGDFTLAEIKTLGGVSTDAERPQQFNGRYKIATIEEVIGLIKKSGRPIALYPETKNPTFHRQQGLPLEDKLLALLAAAGWSGRDAPVFVQSFEPSSLKYMRSKGSALRMIQLIDADDVDLKTGTLTYAPPYDQPYDWKVAGDTRKFSAMVTPA